MKSVGKQLQEARLAKNWTPELAARETKIKVERVRDLEADNYSNFTSPTYARGFVRTYARALGLDEYRILRQLDNKLPDDDSANIVTDTGVAYLPETAMPPRAAHRDYTGLYVVMGLGAVVILIGTFVLFQAYRVGELSSWFASSSENVTSAAGTNSAPGIATADTPLRAKPIDSDQAPPIVDTTTNAPTATDTTNAPAATVASIPGVTPRALPVDLSALPPDSANGSPTNAAPVAATPVPPKALPVDPSELNNTPAATPAPAPAPVTADANPPVAPRALPVDLSELTNAGNATPPPAPSTLVAANNVPPPSVVKPSSTARQSNNGPVVGASASAVDAVGVPSPAPAVVAPTDPAPAVVNDTDKRLVLTASQDSFVRVTNIDQPDAAKPLYASVLHSGQSVGFDGKKFSINVGVPSAVDIKLDGVNYGPHSDQAQPETFTVQSHLP
jgi:cytoskeleton protein RodZ